MSRKKPLIVLFGLLCLSASHAYAQYPVIGAEEVRSRLIGNKKVLLIDSRLPDEYEAGHIPGAINIPAERMKIEATRLPKDKSVPIIFYCRGAG